MEDDPDYDPSTAEDSSEDEEYDSSMVTLDELCHSVALVRNPQTFTPPDGKKVVVEFVDTAIPNSIQCNDASVAVASENVLESCSFMNDGHLSSVDLNPNVMEIGVPNLMDYNICDLPIIIADVSPNCDTQCNEENECPNIFGGPCNILTVPESVGETETEGSKRKRAIAPQPEKWTKNETKEKRLKGHTYLGFRRADKTSTKKILQDTMRDAKQMGPACQNGTCIKYQSRSCREIEDGQRQRLFTDFWNIGSWGEKRMFINSLVKVALPKERKVEGSRRGKTFIYHLKVGDKQLPVCRPMFLNTFGLKWSTVKRWLADYSTIGTQNNQPPSSEEPSNSHQTEVNHELPSREPPSKRWTKLEMMKFLDKFFEKLPKLPSHYCRQSSSKEYLQTDLKSVSQLYDLYKQHCQTDLFSRALSRFTFDKMMKSKNIGFFQPRKDMCDKCSLFAVKNLSQEAMDHHILMKNLARSRKEADKARSLLGECFTLCIDVQAVKLVPRIQASVCYYKMKLAVHNFTVYNLANNDAMCYWFTETDGNLTASTFASCLVDYIQELFRMSGKKPVVIFSDGCPYQNRNSVVSNALLHLAMIEDVSIIQNYLEKGHTQMECDSVHAKIESSIGNRDVHLPSQLVTISQNARQNPSPYRARMLSFDFFHNYSDEETMIYPSIRPGKKPNDPQVIDIRSLLYDPAGKIMFKLIHGDGEEWKPLPRRPKQRSIHSMEAFPKLLREKIKLKKDKYDDLQDLKKFLPEDCRQYYSYLPHEDESIRKAKKKKAQQETAQNKNRKRSYL